MVLRILSSLDQQLLDVHWSTAWPLVGAGQECPWPLWEKSSVSTYRRTHSTSVLLNEMWISASLSRIRDEQFFRKRRFVPKREDHEQGGGQGGEAGAGGRGKGRGRG